MVSAGAQLNVKEIGHGVYTLAKDSDARSQLWDQLTQTAGQVLAGDAFVIGQLTSTVVVPGAAAAKFSRTGSLLSKTTNRADFSGPVMITTTGKATSALDWVKSFAGAGRAIVKRLVDVVGHSLSGVEDELLNRTAGGAAKALSRVPGVSVVGDKVLLRDVEKMTTSEWAAIREASVHNDTASAVTLGKWEGVDNLNSYTSKASDAGNGYFDLGAEWGIIQKSHGLTDKEMFDLFNRPFLDTAIADGKVIQFTHNPVGDPGALGKELDYIKARGYVYDPRTMTARKIGL